MTAVQITITSADYLDPDFGWYEFFGSVTNLTLENVVADAEYSDIAFSTHFLRAGLVPGATWYHWVRAAFADGTEKSGILALGPVVIVGLGTAELADHSVSYLKMQTVSADSVLGSIAGGSVSELALGGANGVASLDGAGKVPAGQLDLSFTDLSDFSDATDVAFNAGDFTGGGSQTWTVTAGEVSTFRYAIFAKTMRVWFTIKGSTVGGTPNSALSIKIPGGKASAKEVYSYCNTYQGAWVGGIVACQASGTTIDISPPGFANWAPSVLGTYVLGQLDIPIL
jgi:hypothetical protein